MESHRPRCLLAVFLALVVVVSLAEAWSGNVCTYKRTCYRRIHVCARRSWVDNSCLQYRTVMQSFVCTDQCCCAGWTHKGDHRCDIPVTTPAPDNATGTIAANDDNNSKAIDA